jgi:hypothetical protein
VVEAVPVFPAPSVAEQETVVTPSGKTDPLAGVHVTARLDVTASVADALP